MSVRYPLRIQELKLQLIKYGTEKKERFSFAIHHFNECLKIDPQDTEAKEGKISEVRRIVTLKRRKIK